MKNDKKLRNLFGAIAMIGAVCAPLGGHAQGDKEGHGGDPALARTWIQPFVEKGLKPAVLAYLARINPERIRSREAAVVISRMILDGGETDIAASPYVIAPKCVDRFGTERAATAVMGQKGGRICFSVERMSLENNSREEIIGLALHEHAHHFGSVDAGNEIVSEVVRTYAEAMKHGSGMPADRGELEPDGAARFGEAILTSTRPEYVCSGVGAGIARILDQRYVAHERAFGGIIGHEARAWHVKSIQLTKIPCGGAIRKSRSSLDASGVRRDGRLLLYPLESDGRTWVVNTARPRDSWAGDNRGASARVKCVPVDSQYAIDREEFLAVYEAYLACRRR